MTVDIWPLDTRTIDTHVHVDAVDYRPIEEFTAFWGSRRAVLSEHFASASSDYIAALVDAHPELYRGLLLLRSGDRDDPALQRVLSAPDRHGARVRLRTDPDVRGVAPALKAIAERDGFVSLHCTWTIMQGAALPRLLDELPDLDVRIEHFGSWPYDEQRDLAPAARDVLARPAVFTMISSQYAFTAEPFPYPSAATVTGEYLRVIGAERVMWSADWNRNDLDPTHSADYLQEAARFLAQVVDPADIPQVQFRTAERFFRFPPAGDTAP